jgi:hypothetical protein
VQDAGLDFCLGGLLALLLLIPAIVYLKANAGKTAQITITALRRKEEVRGT